MRKPHFLVKLTIGEMQTVTEALHAHAGLLRRSRWATADQWITAAREQADAEALQSKIERIQQKAMQKVGA